MFELYNKMKVVIDMFVEFASALASPREEAVSIPRAIASTSFYILQTIVDKSS